MWEKQVDGFWYSYSKIFRPADRNERCGSHVHISKAGGFDLSELKRIAWFTVYHERAILGLLTAQRRFHPYARPNTDVSNKLRGLALRKMALMIDQAVSPEELITIIQGPNYEDRRAIWNFANIIKASQSVEFRGGPSLHDVLPTKWWISFAVGFVHLAISKVCSDMSC